MFLFNERERDFFHFLYFESCEKDSESENKYIFFSYNSKAERVNEKKKELFFLQAEKNDLSLSLFESSLLFS